MSALKIKSYLLPDGETVISYFDSSLKKRVVRKFKDETKAQIFFEKIKEAARPAQTLSETNFETLLRIYLQKNQDCYLSRSHHLVREFLEFFGVFNIHDVTELKMRSFFSQVKNEHNYTEKTMLKIKSMLQGFFKFLIENKVIEKSPLDLIKFERKLYPKRPPLTISDQVFTEIIRLAKTFSPVLFYPIFLLIRETAAAVSDILALKWTDLNLKSGEVTLAGANELQRRHFKISIELILALRRIPQRSDTVFTNLQGRPLYNEILGRELRRFQRRTNLSMDWALKDLRHSFGVNFLKNGGSMKELQKIMGHVRIYNTIHTFGRFQVGNAKEFFVSKAVQETGEVFGSDIKF